MKQALDTLRNSRRSGGRAPQKRDRDVGTLKIQSSSTLVWLSKFWNVLAVTLSVID
jgi:hypothetical protein